MAPKFRAKRLAKRWNMHALRSLKVFVFPCVNGLLWRLIPLTSTPLGKWRPHKTVRRSPVLGSNRSRRPRAPPSMIC